MDFNSARMRRALGAAPVVLWLLVLQLTTVAIAAMACARLLFAFADFLARPRQLPRLTLAAQTLRLRLVKRKG